MTESRVIEVQRRAPGPPEEAFAHFTDPELHLRWNGTAVELDPRPGGKYVVFFGDRAQIRGEYVEVDPPRRLVLLWGWHDQGGTEMSRIAPASTRVEIDFFPDGDGTVVRVRHHDVPAGPAQGYVTWGWTTYIDRLVLACAGEPREPDPFATLGPAGIVTP